MNANSSSSARLIAVRPLVRYVDDQQAVLEIHVVVDWRGQSAVHVAPDAGLSLEITMAAPDESSLTRRVKLSGVNGAGMVRFEIPDPLRWWPAGMGDQPLYDLTLKLMVEETAADTRRITLGLNSVRPAGKDAGGRARRGKPHPRTTLLVNGRPCTIQSVFLVEPLDEQGLLPVGGDSLLIVRKHFGPDGLYDAADRAGIMLVQSIPPEVSGKERSESPADETDAPGSGDGGLAAQVDRLSRHPSLAGWLVEKVDQAAETVIRRLHGLDPTRNVFRQMPGV